MEKGSHVVSREARRMIKKAFISGVNRDFIKQTTHAALEEKRLKGEIIITRKDLVNL